jgi:hypothetical protein
MGNCFPFFRRRTEEPVEHVEPVAEPWTFPANIPHVHADEKTLADQHNLDHLITSYDDDPEGFDRMITELSPHQRILFVNILDKCYCCEEHQLHRPDTYYPLLQENASRNTQQKECDCPCRHIARSICRHEYPDVVATGELV